MAINTSQLLELMLQEIRKVPSQALLQEVKPELETLAHHLAEIAEATMQGNISHEESKVLRDMQKQAWQTELLSIKGRSEIAVQLLIRQALNGIRVFVNNELGWTLL